MPHSCRMLQCGVVIFTPKRFHKTFRIHLCCEKQQAKKHQVGSQCGEGSGNGRDERLKRLMEVAYHIDELMRTLGMSHAIVSEEYKQLINEKFVLSRELHGAETGRGGGCLVMCLKRK
eukprot:905227-Pelagomonas_calceolata.AAC.1